MSASNLTKIQLKEQNFKNFIKNEKNIKDLDQNSIQTASSFKKNSKLNLYQKGQIEINQLLLEQLKLLSLQYQFPFLEKHNISEIVRSKMVDWMIEVFSRFNCQQETFFCAVNLMDEFLILTENQHSNQDIHLLGITSMFVASKLIEINPFTIMTVTKKISHNNFSSKKILQKELELLQTLNYRLYNRISLLQLAELFCVKISLIDEKQYSLFKKTLIYVTKMIMHSYEMLITHPFLYLAIGSIYISLKLREKINSDIQAKKYIRILIKQYKLRDKQLFMISREILRLAQQFQEFYPFANNLFIYDNFETQQIIKIFNFLKRINFS